MTPCYNWNRALFLAAPMRLLQFVSLLLLLVGNPIFRRSIMSINVSGYWKNNARFVVQSFLISKNTICSVDTQKTFLYELTNLVFPYCGICLKEVPVCVNFKELNRRNRAFLTLVLRRAGCNNSPKQFSPWCSKMRSKGEKLLRVSLSSSFLFILAKKFQW